MRCDCTSYLLADHKVTKWVKRWFYLLRIWIMCLRRHHIGRVDKSLVQHQNFFGKLLYAKSLNVCRVRYGFGFHPSAIDKCYFWPKHRLRLEHHTTQWLNTIIEQKSVFLKLDWAVCRPPSLTFWENSERLTSVYFYFYSLLPNLNGFGQNSAMFSLRVE